MNRPQLSLFQLVLSLLMRVLLVTRVWGTSFDTSNALYRMIEKKRWLTLKVLAAILLIEGSIYGGLLILALAFEFQVISITDELAVIAGFYSSISLLASPFYYSVIAAVLTSRLRRDYLGRSDVEQLRLAGSSSKEILLSVAFPIILWINLASIVIVICWCLYGVLYFAVRTRAAPDVNEMAQLQILALYLLSRFLGTRMSVDTAVLGALRTGFDFQSYSPVRIILSAAVYIGFILGVIAFLEFLWGPRNSALIALIVVSTGFVFLLVLSWFNGYISKRQMNQLLARIGDEE